MKIGLFHVEMIGWIMVMQFNWNATNVGDFM